MRLCDLAGCQKIIEEDEEALVGNLVVGEEEHHTLILLASPLVHVLQVRLQVSKTIRAGDHNPELLALEEACLAT